ALPPGRPGHSPTMLRRAPRQGTTLPGGRDSANRFPPRPPSLVYSGPRLACCADLSREVGAMNEESLFAAALERPSAAQRAAFLDQAGAGDAALRQRVERLLAADAHSRGILERGADPVLTPPPPGQPLAAEGVFAGRFTLRH